MNSPSFPPESKTGLWTEGYILVTGFNQPHGAVDDKSGPGENDLGFAVTFHYFSSKVPSCFFPIRGAGQRNGGMRK